MSRTLPLVVDAAPRRKAVEPQRSVIVQAPAGSGKTSLLTQRFLVLLGGVREPEEILAVTFTKKAAAEMRGRILEELERAEDNAPPEKEHERQTWTFARAALQRDKERGWDLRQSPARLRVMTIDALCSAITRQMPLLSRFGASPGVTEEPMALYEQAAEEMLGRLERGGELGAALERLLEHLDNNQEALREMLVTMLGKRDQWLRLVVRIDADPTDDGGKQRRALEQALSRLAEETLQTVRRAVPTELAEELGSLAQRACAQREHEPWTADAQGLPLTDGAGLIGWQFIADMLLTKKGAWRGKFTVSQGFPAESSTKDPEEKTQRRRDKARIARLVKQLAVGAAPLAVALTRVMDLPPDHYRDPQWSVLQALVKVLIRATAQLTAVFAEHGEVDFIEVAQSAVRALGDPDDPTDLALALDYRLQHVLVDEFQDTSVSQIQLLGLLTAGWLPGDGRTLFLVGDPMQSIYRFREADVGLFLRARRQGIGPLHPEEVLLSTNFRSDEGVVRWVNDAFVKVLPVAEDITTGAVPYSASVPRPDAPSGLGVEVHPLLDNDPLAEAELVVRLCQQERDRGHKVAILVRGRTHLSEILPALRRAGFTALGVQLQKLDEQQPILDLVSLTRALLHLGDRLSWLSLLRAPWCGLTLADLDLIARDAAAVDADGERKVAALTLWDRTHDPALLATLSDDGRARLARVRAVLDDCLDRRGRQGLRRWVESAWIALGGPAALRHDHEQQDARTFFELLDGLDRGGDLEDPDELSLALARLYAAPATDADDRLQIMTIHKAKGLEFDAVILPGLGRKTRGDGRRVLRWLERPVAEGKATDLLLAPLPDAWSKNDPIHTYLQDVEKARAQNEDGRLLYVAATRAKKCLHLVGHTKVGRDKKTGQPKLSNPASPSLLKELWPVVRPLFDEALDQQTEQAPAAAVEDEVSEHADPDAEDVPQKDTPNLVRLPEPWVPPPTPPALVVAPAESLPGPDDPEPLDWAGETARHVGRVVHRALTRDRAWDTVELEQSRTRFGEALRALGVPAEELAVATAAVQRALEAVGQHARGRWLFAPKQRETQSDLALCGPVNDQLKRAHIDRTFVDSDGVRWVVEIRTGTHEGADPDRYLDEQTQRCRHQLATGAALAARLDPDHPVKAGVYFPLLGAWREIDLSAN